MSNPILDSNDKNSPIFDSAMTPNPSRMVEEAELKKVADDLFDSSNQIDYSDWPSIDCETCNGAGTIGPVECHDCGGLGNDFDHERYNKEVNARAIRILTTLTDAVRKEERERCAKVCDNLALGAFHELTESVGESARDYWARIQQAHERAATRIRKENE